MKRIALCVLILLSLFACAKKESSQVLATIDGEKITLEEFNKDLDKIPTNMKMLVASESGKKAYLDRLVTKRLLLKEAKKEKIESEKDFQDRLVDIKDQLLIESLLKKKIKAEAQPTEDDLKTFYDNHKERFKQGRQINTRHIILKSEDEAKQILARIKKGEDFIELAKTYSIDPNAKASGGEVGFFPQGSLVPEYEQVAFGLKKKGEISGIVKTKFGYHIIRLEGEKQSSYTTFDEAKEWIKQNYTQVRQTEEIEKFIESLKKTAKITINDGLLKIEEKGQEKTPSDPAKTETPAKEETAGKPKAEVPSKK